VCREQKLDKKMAAGITRSL